MLNAADDITISGSEVGGDRATALLAGGNIAIRAAAQEAWERSRNKSSGYNAGVAISFGSNGMAFGFTAGGNLGKGHGNGDSTAWQYSHIGSGQSATLVQSGGTPTLQGGQIVGKGVDVKAAALNIESVQDTMRYDSRQENISGQVTIGYGASGSASYARSKMNAGSCIGKRAKRYLCRGGRLSRGY
ncbi:hypothetical protein C7N83_10450 [Neisseria iguanae]|uniref:Hemagglutinin n=1 Tax=Neisseria iguanae TaxID=90242 RepID=A0A2P7TYG2_9NEIS|nr:hypothetical protein C7N83_10450 [Neisseria iguanae]